ncbi:MAG: DUF3916 domain-containing protein [Clostridia bacterium]|nr:DUF3916 domain-containing protein [Clostridia bacterium]
MIYKKQRGQKRKLKALLNNINEIRPFQNIDCKYEHFHVPCGQFVSLPKTRGRVKTVYCKAWLDKTAEMIAQKPCDIPFCKVIAVIDELDLSESQIIIFYDKNYYDSFWKRDSGEQIWTPIVKDSLSFIQRRHIDSNLKEKGYYETITDIDFFYKTRLWFYGDINK